MSYDVYKILHLGGMFFLFTMLGGIALHVMNGGTRESNTGRKLTGALHGLALFVILLGGFGMLARLGMDGGLPGWIYLKLAIWIAMPVLGTLPYRRPATAKAVLIALPLIGILAAWVATYKPL
ncbi:MAG: hypothetical protein SFU57_12045 [Gemmatimonadales bacterium]|nr:hypothetical protein [Gemmatimonadales bacterium]